MSDAIKQLAELLRDANVKVTFSRWCISGIVERCECSRCRRKRGDAVTAETERAAEIRSIEERLAFRDRVIATMPKEILDEARMIVDRAIQKGGAA